MCCDSPVKSKNILDIPHCSKKSLPVKRDKKLKSTLNSSGIVRRVMQYQ